MSQTELPSLQSDDTLIAGALQIPPPCQAIQKVHWRFIQLQMLDFSCDRFLPNLSNEIPRWCHFRSSSFRRSNVHGSWHAKCPLISGKRRFIPRHIYSTPKLKNTCRRFESTESNEWVGGSDGVPPPHHNPLHSKIVRSNRHVIM